MISVRFNLIKLPYLLYVCRQIDLSKPYRLGKDTTEHDVESGSTLFATHLTILHTFSCNKIDLLKRGIRKRIRGVNT